MSELASILVGDHLGQVKKVLWPSCELSMLSDLSEPSKLNPIVSIELMRDKNKHLIGHKNGQLSTFDAVSNITKQCDNVADDSLVKALPTGTESVILIYDKRIQFDRNKHSTKIKRGTVKDGKTHETKLAIVGADIPLHVMDIESGKRLYEAERPGKDWLGIEQGCEVVALDFVGGHRVATCSKSDSVIRVYDTQSKTKPIITVDINQTAFNEYAEAGRFMSVASTGDSGHSIVVGSNVGQMIAIDLRFNVRETPKKKLQPKLSKILGGFKGARGATIKDIKLAPAHGEEGVSYKVISCCLDRYLRVHNFSKLTRHLDKHVYMKTRPLCCSPVYYNG